MPRVLSLSTLFPNAHTPRFGTFVARQMEALADFDTTVTFCFTPEHLGPGAHHTSPPHDPQQFADFCAAMIERYAPGRVEATPAAIQPALT